MLGLVAKKPFFGGFFKKFWGCDVFLGEKNLKKKKIFLAFGCLGGFGKKTVIGRFFN